MIRDALQYLITLGQSETIPGMSHLRIIPDDYSIRDMEQHLDAPIRHRLKITTQSLQGFVDLCNTEETKFTKRCFVNDKELAATTFFDMGNRDDFGHGDHHATLKLRCTAEFDNLVATCGSQRTGGPMSQQALAEWMEDWSDFLSVDGDAGLPGAIAAVRNLTVDTARKAESRVEDLGSSRSTMEKISLSGRDAPPPTRLMFTCVPYYGLRQREIQLRASVSTRGDEPVFSLRIVREDELLDRLAIEFSELLQSRLEDSRVVVGKVVP